MPVKEEWKSATMVLLELCAMTTGISWKQMLSVGN